MQSGCRWQNSEWAAASDSDGEQWLVCWGCFWPGNVLPSEEMSADADFVDTLKNRKVTFSIQGPIQQLLRAAAQATAYGFPSSEPEPQALPSRHDGLARLGFLGLGLGRLAALGRAVHITSINNCHHQENPNFSY
jgi:hypothetical protein